MSLALMLAGCAFVAALAGHGWSWPRFAVGAALGVVAIGASEFALIVALRAVTDSAAAFHAARQRMRSRRPALYPGYVATGVAAGVIAAALPSWWPDAIYGAVIVLVNVVLPLALIPRIRQRAAAARA